MVFELDAVNDIVSTMSKRDKQLLNLSDDVYQRRVEDGANVVKRIVKRVNGVPVSFFDVTGDSSGVAISIGTRRGGRISKQRICFSCRQTRKEMAR